LQLQENRNLLPKNKKLNIYFADQDKDEINYTVNTEEQYNDLGVVFQDEENQAALIFYKDDDDENLVLDGTIGDTLVVKPATQTIKKYMKNKSLTSDPPDEWLNSNEKILRKSIPISEEEELPVDYAFLGRFSSIIKKMLLIFLN